MLQVMNRLSSRMQVGHELYVAGVRRQMMGNVAVAPATLSFV